MKIRERYRRLTLWNKIAFWAAIATFCSVIITLYFRCVPSSSETEILERTKAIQNQTAKRILTSEQQAQMVEALKIYAHKKIKVETMLGDSEAIQFAKYFITVFKKAEWSVDDMALIANQPHFGIKIRINNMPPPEHAEAIANVLKSLGFEVKGEVRPTANKDTIRLLIGSKQ